MNYDETYEKDIMAGQVKVILAFLPALIALAGVAVIGYL